MNIYLFSFVLCLTLAWALNISMRPEIILSNPNLNCCWRAWEGFLFPVTCVSVLRQLLISSITFSWPLLARRSSRNQVLFLTLDTLQLLQGCNTAGVAIVWYGRLQGSWLHCKTSRAGKELWCLLGNIYVDGYKRGKCLLSSFSKGFAVPAKIKNHFLTVAVRQETCLYTVRMTTGHTTGKETSLGWYHYLVTHWDRCPESSILAHKCKGSGLTLPSLCAAEGLMHGFSWVCCVE